MGTRHRRAAQHRDDVTHDSPTGLDPKKRTLAARERDDGERAAWWSATLKLPAADLVFVDETSTQTAMTLHYAYAPRGRRANASAPRNHGPNVTLVSALTLAGSGPALVLEGALTTEGFMAYIEQLLVPVLRPGQVVIVDNLAVHTNARIRQAIERAQCTLRFLPPYSPDFNPIEWAIAKLKAKLRRAASRSFETLVLAIRDALAAITPADARGWFYGCGYVPLGQPL
jgi:transposase